MNNGWIKIHRQIRNHWLWEDPVKLQRWLTVLLEVNFKPGKIVLGNAIITIERGYSANSLRTWAGLFKCGTKAATNFFDLLEKDEMISRKTIGTGKHSTTLIKITNYDDYQSLEETITATQATTLTATQRKRKGHTIEEEKEETKIKKEERRESALDFLENKFPSQFEIFEMNNKNQILDYAKFKLDFNDTVIQEDLSFDKLLFPRLRKYARNWIKNNNTNFNKKNKYTNEQHEPRANRQTITSATKNSQGFG